MHLLFQQAGVPGFAFSGVSYRTWIFVHLAAQKTPFQLQNLVKNT